MFITKFFQVVVLLLVYQRNLQMVTCQDTVKGTFSADTLNNIIRHQGKHGVEREQKLYHSCSKQFMQLFPRKRGHRYGVDAVGSRNSPFTHVLIKSTVIRNRDGVTIRNKDGFYLCFKQNGKLVARPEADEKLRCLFKDEETEGYVRWRSQWKKSWYIGFDVRGNPLNGIYDNPKSVHDQRCFNFIKCSIKSCNHSNLDHSESAVGPTGNFDWSILNEDVRHKSRTKSIFKRHFRNKST
ncbi:fibroblast growth factor 18-like isoform X1 [Limulus polyphemus]|uniref:Fibroblast growth factor 18-like isoform X1 n=2 Tax=Limulus polyphemus TaxID=6850 RepID=A0ABM1SS63_LIMPO|nr:fibroblast growth factor 18-like isoform X1 [Limulus polyphemus]